jgi:outer membrane protein assembly factor BamB
MQRNILVPPLVVFLAVCGASLTATCAENWPAWRGPTGLGVSTERDLPVTWSTTENIRWKIPLPAPGNSTPIMWGDRIFLTQAQELTQWPPKVPDNYAGGASPGGYAIAEKRSVLCFSRSDGKLLWQADVPYKEPELTHPTNPMCSASPVTDGERVIASLGPAGLVCYDLEGHLQWKFEVGKIEHLWGTASSPILYDDLCIQWCGPGDRQFLVALNKRTGEKIWQTDEPGGDAGITTKTFLGSWSTPLVARIGEQDQLIFALPRSLKGYDPRTGKELWSAKLGGSYCYHSPLLVDGIAIFGADLIKLGGIGEITGDRLGHRVAAMYISTAAVDGDHLYTINGVGVPSCFAWRTGEDLWKPQIDKRPGGTGAWGSPVVADGRLYITDQKGTTSVFSTGPKYEHLALNKLDETTNASIAISSGNLFIRTWKHLWCIGQPKPAE